MRTGRPRQPESVVRSDQGRRAEPVGRWSAVCRPAARPPRWRACASRHTRATPRRCPDRWAAARTPRATSSRWRSPVARRSARAIRARPRSCASPTRSVRRRRPRSTRGCGSPRRSAPRWHLGVGIDNQGVVSDHHRLKVPGAGSSLPGRGCVKRRGRRRSETIPARECPSAVGAAPACRRACRSGAPRKRSAMTRALWNTLRVFSSKAGPNRSLGIDIPAGVGSLVPARDFTGIGGQVRTGNVDRRQRNGRGTHQQGESHNQNTQLKGQDAP